MGGHLTVSSVEHHGSTFTFVVPYKISSNSDNSDDPDELSDMDHQDSVDDGNDEDLHAGVFVFQPRTLGSLFSSQSSGRIQKLTPLSIGLNGLMEDSLSPSSNITYREMSSEEDESAAMETSSQLQVSHNLNFAEKNDKGHSEMNNGEQSANLNEISETSISQERCATQAETDSSCECSTSKSQEAKPKILLVDDNKINIMIAKSMMKQLGHSIDVANNGAEAVRAVLCESYDLVLMVCMELEIFNMVFFNVFSFYIPYIT